MFMSNVWSNLFTWLIFFSLSLSDICFSEVYHFLFKIYHFLSTDSVICFQCSASSPDEPCVTDTADMANASTRDIFVKNCTDTSPKFDRCMIQTVESGGEKIYYIIYSVNHYMSDYNDNVIIQQLTWTILQIIMVI